MASAKASQLDDPEEHARRVSTADEAIAKHKGTRMVRRLRNARRVLEVWSDFATHFVELLENCESEASIVALTRNVGDRTEGQQLEQALDRALMPYVAGLAAVVEQSRPLLDYLEPDTRAEADRRLAALKADHPQAIFLTKLRNYVLHYLTAPWVFRARYAAGQPLRGEVALSTQTLLEWNHWAGAATFVRAAGDRIVLRPLIWPHFKATAEHTEWLLEAVWNDREDLVAEANALIAERNLILTGGLSDGADRQEREAELQAAISDLLRDEQQASPDSESPAV